MGLVDTHCHLQDPKFDEDRQEVLARALAVLDWLLVIGDCLESSLAALELAGEQVYAAVGVHPYHPEEIDNAGMLALRKLAEQPRVVAIGEIGLDYFRYNDAPHDVQKQSFRDQLTLACELGLPVVIHNRDANDDVLNILDEYTRDLRGVIMHCFSGDAEFARKCVDHGYYVSFAGNVTYPKAGQLREAAAAVSLDRLLVETDSPYLAPQAVRGKRCEPAFVVHTAHTLAEMKEISPEELARKTTENAKRVFSIA
jgi:TatD DNase family protein